MVKRGLFSCLDYYYLLKHDPDADMEWLRVIDHLAVQETRFWREIEQVQAVAQILVPQHFAAFQLREIGRAFVYMKR